MATFAYAALTIATGVALVSGCFGAALVFFGLSMAVKFLNDK